MSITPFHFACHTEDRLRAQFEILDKPLGDFVQVQRRFSLTENRAVLQFGAKPAAGADFAPHVTFSIQQVPQKERQTAFNCVLDCPATKAHRAFRLLIEKPDEAETQILKVLDFLQKAFQPLGYTGAKTVAASDVDAAAEAKALETAKALMMKATAAETAAMTEEAKTATKGKKYLVENAASGEVVKLRTYDGKYVPDGELPAELRINNTKAPMAPAHALEAKQPPPQ